MHLRYDMSFACEKSGQHGHPQKVMEDLGIYYQWSTPQSIADQWWFWNCDGVPAELPEFLSELKVDPMKCIGYGLSEEKAKEITNDCRA